MIRAKKVLAGLIALMILVFAYSFWIAAQKAPHEGGPQQSPIN
jgi:hypothetical protein